MTSSALRIPLLLAVIAASYFSITAAHADLLHSVVKAPIVPDGDVAGARMDYVFNFADIDPAVPGFSLAPGDQLRIYLPDDFVLADTATYPIANVGEIPTCVPGNLQCTTGVLLQGWPQNPLPVSAYDFDIVDNVVIYTVTGAIGPNPFGPGMKQAHVIGNGLFNPAQPGHYPVRVELQRGADVEVGTGSIQVRPNPRASINVTSVFDVPPDDPNGGAPPNPNFIYQQTGPGHAAPLTWNFLLWDTHGQPYTDIEIAQVNRNGGLLVRGGSVVGTFRITSPKGARGQHLVSLGPSFVSGTPVIGMTFDPPLRTGRLRAMFVAGSEFGRYEIELRLNNGTSATMVVDVVE